jgi:hypothetical protein
MKGRRAVLVVFFLLAWAPAIWADSITFDLTTPLPGEPTLSGSLPWLTATISVQGGIATLAMSAPGLTASENIKEWWFHFNDPSNPSKTPPPYFQYVSGVAASGILYSQNNLGPNSSAQGGGFDIKFDFPDANSSDARFVGGEFSVYTIEVAEVQLTLDWFTKSIGNQFYYSAAHVRSLYPTGDSSKIGDPITPSPVPEPATMLLFGMGLSGFGFWIRRRSAH